MSQRRSVALSKASPSGETHSIGAPDGATPFPSYLDVDYVRLYQR